MKVERCNKRKVARASRPSAPGSRGPVFQKMSVPRQQCVTFLGQCLFRNVCFVRFDMLAVAVYLGNVVPCV
jgi:hypothetical protein